MADRKELHSVVAFMLNCVRLEWVFLTQEKAEEVYKEIGQRLYDRERITTHMDDFGFTMTINLKMVSHIHLVTFTDAHRRRIDVEDTQEVIAEAYEHEHFGQSEVGFGSKS